MHRTLGPAVDVFQKATERYPNSPRLMIGLGMALYSRGNYDDAVRVLLKGADLNPSDAQSAMSTLHKAYSGYVHGAYPHIMELYGGNPARFHMAGMRDTRGLWRRSPWVAIMLPEPERRENNQRSNEGRNDVAQ